MKSKYMKFAVAGAPIATAGLADYKYGRAMESAIKIKNVTG